MEPGLRRTVAVRAEEAPRGVRRPVTRGDRTAGPVGAAGREMPVVRVLRVVTARPEESAERYLAVVGEVRGAAVPRRDVRGDDVPEDRMPERVAAPRAAEDLAVLRGRAATPPPRVYGAFTVRDRVTEAAPPVVLPAPAGGAPVIGVPPLRRGEVDRPVDREADGRLRSRAVTTRSPRSRVRAMEGARPLRTASCE